MARTWTPETTAALRARLAYLRELGIYDLYSRGTVTPTVEVEGEDTAVSVHAGDLEHVAVATPSVAPVMAKVANAVPPAPEIEESTEAPEDHEIVARKRAQPAAPPLTLPGVLLPAAARASALAAVRTELGDCTRCPLAFEGRQTIVFGDGDPNARLLFVGEGPGADEDAQGIPFIGKAGQLLNNMITAMGMQRSEVYIANIVKCRPPANRVPEPVEANTCTPFLLEQIGVVRPEVIVALGSTAATYLLGAKSPLSALRGRIHPAFGTKLIVTYHPAYLLRDPRQKKEAWADLQLAMRELASARS